MSRSRLLSAFVLAALALSPALGLAQGAPQTHTVKKGDTLWDLAQQYLGDPFKWPEIYRRNTATVKDPNLIYPDQVLVISGEVAATPGTPADAPAPADSMAPMQAPAMAADTAEAPMAMAPDMTMPKPMTIFNPDRFRVVRTTRASLVLRSRGSAVRAGDFARAPFLWDAAGITGAGKVGSTVGSEGVAPTRFVRPAQMYERVFVTLPAAASGAVGEQFMSYRYGPLLAGEGQVVIPTGVLRLVTAAQDGKAEALLLTKYEEVTEGQGLIPSDSLSMPNGVFPARVEFGLRTSIVWLYDEPVVPSIGQHMVLAAGASDGLVPGDQVTIQRDLGLDDKGVPLPPLDIAVLQITRVTTWGASAILIAQSEGVITPGMAARVTAKMP
jgi:hypothetical protein